MRFTDKANSSDVKGASKAGIRALCVNRFDKNVPDVSFRFAELGTKDADYGHLYEKSQLVGNRKLNL